MSIVELFSIASRNNKLLVTTASLLVTGALLVVTMFASRNNYSDRSQRSKTLQPRERTDPPGGGAAMWWGVGPTVFLA